MTENRLFLGFDTAFWIWRKAGPLAYSALTPSRIRSLSGGAPTKAKVEEFISHHPDLALDRLDLVVGYGDQRRVPGTTVHIRREPLPERSFYKLDDNVYVASPELCLMQLATKLSEPQIVKLALEMCGFYAIDPSDPGSMFDFSDLLDEESGMSKRPPLTNATKLKAYAKRLFAPDSRAPSAHYLRYVIDGSASPRETALYMLLCMPLRLGGYGLALPELNKRIELTQAEKLMVGARHFDCDLYWDLRRRSIAVEYDSRKHHTALEKQERDAIRRNMLQYKDVQVIVATRTQINKPSEFDKLAHQIGKAIGKRFRIPEKEHIKARANLRKVLFDWDVIPVPEANPYNQGCSR